MIRRIGVSVPAVLVVLWLVWAAIAVTAAEGPPLKENVCSTCHKDFSKMMPKGHPDIGADLGKSCLECHVGKQAKGDTAKFVDLVHKTHQGGKTTLECTTCHAL